MPELLELLPFSLDVMVEVHGIASRRPPSPITTDPIIQINDHFQKSSVRSVIGEFRQLVGDGYSLRNIHDARVVSADIILATEVHNRIWRLIRDVTEIKTPLSELDGGDQRFIYDRNSGSIHLKQEYFGSLFDLSNETRISANGIFFDTELISFSSPTKMRSRPKVFAMLTFMGMRILTFEAGYNSAEVAAIEMTKAQQTIATTFIERNLPTMIAATGFGYQIYADRSTKYDQDLRKEEDIIYQDLSNRDLRSLQRCLRDLNFYHGDIDGIDGTITRDAVREFAKSVGLGSIKLNTTDDYFDQELRRNISNQTAKLRVSRGWS